MKICTRCKSELPTSQFRRRAKSNDGLESACKDCRRAYDNKTYALSGDRRSKIRASNLKRRLSLATRVREYLSNHPCVDCGQSDPELLEFDHVRGEKKAGVGQLLRDVVSWEVIAAEIDKCEVRCLYCHLKRTIKQLGWYASLV